MAELPCNLFSLILAFFRKGDFEICMNHFSSIPKNAKGEKIKAVSYHIEDPQRKNREQIKKAVEDVIHSAKVFDYPCATPVTPRRPPVPNGTFGRGQTAVSSDGGRQTRRATD